METEYHHLRVFFFPMMAPGHTIPMIDIARLFAARGTKSIIISTPLNALRFSESIARDRQSGLDISIQTIPFPAAQAGLPEGCESFDLLTAPEMAYGFFKALTMLQTPFEQLLEEQHPDWIVSDKFFHWTTDAAKKYGILRLIFHGTSNFSLCVAENVKRYAPQEVVISESEMFVVPGLPDKIEMTKLQLPHQGNTSNSSFAEMYAKMQDTETNSFGVLVNSFYELESSYTEYYKKDMGRKAWNIGPVSLYNRDDKDKAQRGKKASFGAQHCLKWLDLKEPDSVLYISFGSVTCFCAAQLKEIALGLEASEIPFVWVVRTSLEKEEGDILPVGFEERIKGKGLIFREWAPQILILDHPSVGGFMTHCGWNSTQEGISAGVPLITWPIFAEQFNNEMLVTQVLKTGISARNRSWCQWIQPNDVSVRKERIKEVVTQVMGNGEQIIDLRKRARELGERAKQAVGEAGSSYNDLSAVIEELRAFTMQV